jgi:hypothetical protein
MQNNKLLYLVDFRDTPLLHNKNSTVNFACLIIIKFNAPLSDYVIITFTVNDPFIKFPLGTVLSKHIRQLWKLIIQYRKGYLVLLRTIKGNKTYKFV